MKYILLFIGAVIVFELGNYAYQMIRIGAGYNAKIMCSCVFVSGREPQSVMDQELAVSAAGFIGAEVDMTDQSATASYLGIKRKAIYRPGAGCTLLSELKESVVRQQTFPVLDRTPDIGADTVQWPYGAMDTLSVPAGVDTKAVDEALDFAFEEPFKDNPRFTRAALVVYKGKIIGERYADGFSANTPLLGWSMTKSVTNTLVGILVGRGKLDLGDVADVPEWHTHPMDRRAQIKLDDLMHMTSGLDFEEDYSKVSDVNKMLWTKASASDEAAQSQMAHPINTHWYYSSGTTNIISRIIRRKFDNDFDYWTFPYKALFGPLGMTSAVIEPDASGTFVGSSFMYATARDWAKWGLLYLNDGVWNGQRILPEGWVKYSSQRTPVLKEGFYSAQFWNNAYSEPEGSDMPRYWPEVPEDAYYASGFEGQQVVIIPSLDLVVVRLGCTSDRYNWDIGAFLTKIVKALPEE